MDTTLIAVIAVAAIAAVYVELRVRHKAAPTPAAAAPASHPSSPSQQPALEVIKQCIRDEAEKTRTAVAEKHAEVTGKVEALHKRWDKDDEKERGGKSAGT